MSKISIIIPVYNTENFLENCLDSIFNQTFQDFEIIVVNDGSTDNSENLINDYIDKYPTKIKYFKKSHIGIANIRNFAVNQVSSEYFLFVDSDDYLEIDLLNNLFLYIDKYPNIDIIKYKLKIFYSNNTQKIDGPVFDLTDGESAFNKLCFTDKMIDTPCLYLFKTNFFIKNSFKFLPNTYHEDFGLIPLIIAEAKNFISTDIYGYNYIQVQNSITRNSDYSSVQKKAYDLLLHYDNLLVFLHKCNLKEKTIKNLKQYYTNAILLATKNLKNSDSKFYIKEIKIRKLHQNIQVNNLKQFFKKLILIISIKLYLKIQ